MPDVQAQTVGTRCWIKVEESADRLSLQGVVAADRPVKGMYQMSLKKKGPSGSSNINQGGDVNLLSSGELLLNRVDLSAEKDTSYSVILSVKIDNDTYVCPVEIIR